MPRRINAPADTRARSKASKASYARHGEKFRAKLMDQMKRERAGLRAQAQAEDARHAEMMKRRQKAAQGVSAHSPDQVRADMSQMAPGTREYRDMFRHLKRQEMVRERADRLESEAG